MGEMGRSASLFTSGVRFFVLRAFFFGLESHHRHQIGQSCSVALTKS